MLRTTLCFLTYFMLLNCCFAQQQELIAPSGAEVQTGNFQVSYSIGEVVVSTGQASNSAVTQGYHQSTLKVTGISTNLKELSLKVFPNPTVGHLTIQSTELEKISKITIYDIKGALVLSVTNDQPQKLSLDLTSLSAGVYHLIARTDINDLTNTYQIIKTN